jgi:hypothetical protein
MPDLNDNQALKTYRSKDGRHTFTFRFVRCTDEIEIYCLSHPSLGGRDPNPHKTHLFPSGRLCFVEGHGPRTQQRAQELTRQWAEYFLEYARTGIAQS